MSLLSAFLAITADWDSVFPQQRTFQRAVRQALGSLVCLGRSCLTRILWTNGGQHRSWSAEYFLHSRCTPRRGVSITPRSRLGTADQIRNPCERSFVSQGHHGIDPGGSKCRQVSGQESAGDQDCDRSTHRERIVRLDAKQERLQQGRGLVGGSESD